MLRIRFHGRGGQGMKTASRILGSAAFHAGRVVQDSPVYGAERRGAPMAAFTRIASEPILERGAIVRPDLVVVADETLLDDPAALPSGGCDAGTTLLVNSARPPEDLRPRAGTEGRLLSADFTALAFETAGTLAALSTALGLASAALVGLPAEAGLEGLRDELGETGLDPAARASNERLGRLAYHRARAWAPVRERVALAVGEPVALVDVPYASPARAAPSIYAAANSPERRTGSWRQFRPVLEPDLCSRCWLCFVACPEAAISLDGKEYPVVDYDTCKGCLLCAHECPTHAFRVEREAR